VVDTRVMQNAGTNSQGARRSLLALAATGGATLIAAVAVVGAGGGAVHPTSSVSPHGLVVHSTLSDPSTDAPSTDAPVKGHTVAASVDGGVVSVASTPTGNGWWDATPAGDVYSFGDAGFHGSIGGAHLNQPIVGIAATPSGGGYWLVASDGGIFSFGDAAFQGSTGAIALNQPIVGMTTTPSGHGYWLVARDGGIFSFGDATFHGSVAGTPLAAPIVAMAPSATGQGYWLVGGDGGVFSFGDAPGIGGALGVIPAGVVGAAPLPGDKGVRLIGADGSSAGLTPGAPVAASAAPASTVGNTNAFSYLVANDDGSPARFNPCSSIHYVTNLAAAPSGADVLISGALSRITTATGVSFVNDGPTTEVPMANRPAVQSRYGSSWAPVIIAWAHSGQSDLLPGGSTIGEGGSSWVSQGGPKVFITGEAVVDADTTANLPASFGSGASIGELLLHELGHVMGLGHSTDPNQIMYPTLLPMSSAAYGAGDLNGLSHLGRAAGCLTVPAA